MRSARTVPNKWLGHEARFFTQGLRYADPLFRHHYSPSLAIEPEASGKRGISAFVARTASVRSANKDSAPDRLHVGRHERDASILALRGSAPRRSRIGKPRRTRNRACHLHHHHVDVYRWLSILAGRWSPWSVAAAVLGAGVWRAHQPDRSGGGHGYAQNVKAPESLEVEMRASHSSTTVSALSFSRSCWPSPPGPMRGRGRFGKLPASRQNRSDLGAPYQLVSDNWLVDLVGES